MKPEQDKTLRRAPKTNEKNTTAPSAEQEERIKLLLDNLKRKVTRTPNQKATGAGYILNEANAREW